MNNYCRNCGEKLEDNAKICPKCNTEVYETRINTEQMKIEDEEYKRKENTYIIIVIALYALSFLSSFTLYFIDYSFYSFIRPLLFLSATITLIYARITMNKSAKIRIMFNIFMILLVLYLAFIILLVISCASALNKGC